MFVYKSKTKVYQVISKENFQHIFVYFCTILELNWTIIMITTMQHNSIIYKKRARFMELEFVVKCFYTV